MSADKSSNPVEDSSPSGADAVEALERVDPADRETEEAQESFPDVEPEESVEASMQAFPDEEPEEFVEAEQALQDEELDKAEHGFPEEQAFAEMEPSVSPESESAEFKPERTLIEMPVFDQPLFESEDETEIEPEPVPEPEPEPESESEAANDNERGGVKFHPKRTLIEIPAFDQDRLGSDSPTANLSEIGDDEFEPAIPEIDDDEFGIEMAEPEPDPIIGQILFNEYLVTSLVGSGPALITYRAKQQTRDEFIALKTTRQRLPSITSEFVEAATNHLSLDHKNIAASLGLYQTEPDCPFYATEWLDGISLMAISRETGALTDEDELSQIIFEICDALEYAHARGVTHGDLVTSNVIMCLIDDDLHAKLTDFGFGRVQRKLEALQDPSITESEDADSPLWLEDQKKNDILMLGNLLLGLVTGTEVIPGSTGYRPRLSETCPGLMATDVLDSVLDEALEPDPDWRFNSIGEFREGFRNWLTTAREERKAADLRQAEQSPLVELEVSESSDLPQPAVPPQVASPDGVSPEDLALLTGRSGLSGVLPVQSETGGPPPKRRTREVRKTVLKMTALKERQVEEDDKLSTQIFQVISKEQARVSPAKAVTMLTVKIIAAVSVFLLSFTYLVLNWNDVVESWRETSVKVSDAMRHRDKDEVLPEELAGEAPEQATEAETAAAPGSQSGGAAGTTATSGAAAPPVRRAHPKFSYKESPAYRHWVIHEVGSKRRIEPDQ